MSFIKVSISGALYANYSHNSQVDEGEGVVCKEGQQKYASKKNYGSEGV